MMYWKKKKHFTFTKYDHNELKIKISIVNLECAYCTIIVKSLKAGKLVLKIGMVSLFTEK